MCCDSVFVWKSLFSFSIARRSNTGPRAAIQPIRRPPANGLRQRVAVDHVPGRQLAQRRRQLAVETHVGVDAVLEHEEVPLAGQRGQALAAPGAEITACIHSPLAQSTMIAMIATARPPAIMRSAVSRFPWSRTKPPVITIA